MADIKINVNADAKGFHRMLDTSASNVMAFSANLKAALVVAFGVRTLGMIGKNILNTGKDITSMADQLDISTDMAQRLQWTARNGHVNISVFSQGMYALDKAMALAKGGDTDMKDRLAKLGITNLDMRKEDALMRIVGYAADNNIPRNQTESLLNQLGVRPSVAGKIMGASGELLNKNIPIVKEDDLRKLHTIENTIENIKTILIQALIPVLLKLKDIILFLKNLLDTYIVHKMFVDEAKKKGKTPNIVRRVWEFSMFTGRNLMRRGFNAFTSIGSKMGILNDDERKRFDEWLQQYIGDTMYKNLYGEKGFAAGKHLIDTTTRPETILDKILVELDKVLNAKPSDKSNEAYNREPIPFNQSDKKGSPMELGELGTNEFMKIGNVLGIDAQYRITRLNVEANKFLSRWTNAIEQLAYNNETMDGQPESQ